MRKLFFCCLLMCFFNTYCQTKISGIIYKDSTLTETISNVKIVFKSIKNNRCIHAKTDINGHFSLLLTEPEPEYRVKIKKKNYIPITIESFLIPKESKGFYLKLILKKMLSLHDENYNGVSKLISIEKT